MSYLTLNFRIRCIVQSLPFKDLPLPVALVAIVGFQVVEVEKEMSSSEVIEVIFDCIEIQSAKTRK